jgi:type IV secretory pathway VirB3-like protein
MAEDERNSWEVAQVEYDKAISEYSHYSVLRRQDMAFVTTVQAAALTIIGTKLLTLDASSFLLSFIAFFVLLIGINSEYRLAAYMVGNLKRAKQIELEYGMTRLIIVAEKVNRRRLVIPVCSPDAA